MKESLDESNFESPISANEISVISKDPAHHIMCPCCSGEMSATHVCDSFSDNADCENDTEIVNSDKPPDPPDIISDSEAKALIESIRSALSRPMTWRNTDAIN